MKKLAILALVTLLASANGVSVMAADITNSELTQVATELGHQYDATYATKDPAAMALVYTQDGVLVSPSGPIVRGREALRAYYSKRFASGAQGHHIKVLEVHVMGDGGYSINQFSVTVPRPNGTLREEHGTIVAVYQHDPDGWHMALVAPSVPEKAGK
jgi:uncharacterized protein (TIGR02246 family)